MSYLNDHPYATSSAVRDADGDLARVQRSMNEVMLAQTPAEIDKAAAMVQEYQSQVASDLANAKQTATGDTGDLSAVTAEFSALQPLWADEIRLARSGEKAQALQSLRQQTLPMSVALGKHLEHLVDVVSGQSAAVNKSAQNNAANAYRSSMIALILFVILGCVFAVILTRSIVRPLQEAVVIAEQVADGNLTVQLSEDPHSDEVAVLLRSLGAMVSVLRAQIREVLQGIAVLTSSASELAATSTQFASASTETASSVSQTTATVEEVKQTSRVASERAQEVADRAQYTVQVSQKGQDAVGATVGGIQHIRQQMTFIAESVVSLSEQNRAISDIISSVDDLAEQSNLLAVNASIEAAKAGEHGKGFSVVAREVKNLAEQSRQATRQVRAILNDIQKATGATVMATEQGSKSVDAGVSQANEVGEALRVLTQSIADWATMMQQIVSTSQQQYIGIDQVTLAMESIKVASSQSVDGARQLEGASRSLDDLGKRLHGLVARYRV
jgi:methyl-accepting chemotaxis protein